MQHVKSQHREQAQQTTKKKMVNLNLKVINYAGELMEKIARNTTNLSKPIQEYSNDENINIK